VENIEPKILERSKSVTVFNVLTDKHMLASFTSNVISMGFLLTGSVITFIFNKLQPQELNR
jgi:hypothetical protein